MRKFFHAYLHELKNYFFAPPAYALLIVYLLLSGFFTLTFGGFLESPRADLNGFFVWQPWLLLFIGAALCMGQWSEEYRSGTAELLLTMPVPHAALVAAKFAAAWSVLLCGLLLTAPLPLTCAWLGNPDWGPVATGYFACALAAALSAALGQAASIVSRSQFVSFITAFLVGLAALLTGFLPCNLLLLKWGCPPGTLDFLARHSITTHFNTLAQGTLTLAAPTAAILAILLLLAFTAWRLARRHTRAPSARFGRAAIAGALLLALLAAALFLPGRIDCTADRLYSLDPGSKSLLADLRHPVTIAFHYSRNFPELTAPQRSHAARVEELLRRLRDAAPRGAITLQFVNPETPEAQAAAETAGLAPNAGSMGQLWFLGATIAAPDAGTPTQCIPFLDPRDAHELEYRLVSAIVATQNSRRRRIGVVSALPIFGDAGSATRRPHERWWTLRQLARAYELVEVIPSGTGPLPEDLDLLLVVHPRGLSAERLQQILDFLRHGRPLLLALDPLNRVEAQARRGLPPASAAIPPELLRELGLALDNAVVADRELATPMTHEVRGVESVPTLLSIPAAQLDQTCPVTAHLNQLVLFCAGALAPAPGAHGATLTPLAQSTADARRLKPWEAQRIPADILLDYHPDGKPAILAAIAAKGPARAIVVADADWLANSLVIQQTTDQHGLPRETTVSDNAAFLVNAVDFLCDDARLIRLRTRGLRQRTFTRLEALGQQAQQRIAELSKAAFAEERPLRERHAAIARQAALIRDNPKLDPELRKLQQEELRRQLEQLEAEDLRHQNRLKAKQRQELLALRHELDRIERRVALLDIGLVPALLAVAMLLVAWKRSH